MSWFLLDCSFVPNGIRWGDSKKAGEMGKQARQTGCGIPAVLFFVAAVRACVRACECADCAILGAEDEDGRIRDGWVGLAWERLVVEWFGWVFLVCIMDMESLLFVLYDG